MAITYTNRRGRVYHLCYRISEKGKVVYFLSRKPMETPADELPEGYEIHEDEEGIVSVRKRESTAAAKPRSIRGPEQPPLKPGMARCPVCKEIMKQTSIRNHVKGAHPYYTPSMAIVATAKKPSSPPRKFRRASLAMKGDEVYRPSRKNIEPVKVKCGWCYRTIWRHWQANGYYRYYDDEEMKHKHRCIRPVHWQPDTE